MEMEGGEEVQVHPEEKRLIHLENLVLSLEILEITDLFLRVGWVVCLLLVYTLTKL